jgi:hypothetical protein
MHSIYCLCLFLLPHLHECDEIKKKLYISSLRHSFHRPALSLGRALKGLAHEIDFDNIAKN